MRIYSDKYIGKKYGKLTVISYSHSESYETKSRKRYTHYFNFKCDCGNVITANIQNVVAGRTQSCRKCGIDHWIGKKIGKTTIVNVERGEKYTKHFTLKCSCGKEFVTSASIVSTNKNNSSFACKECMKNETTNNKASSAKTE